MLVVLETHPIQYHAPLYRALQTQFDISVTAIYGSDFSIAGYRDREFGADFAWDVDLLSGYKQIFLSRVAHGGARNYEKVSARGLGKELGEITPKAALVLGYLGFNRAACYQVLKAGLPILFRGETTDHAQQRNPLKAALRDSLLRRSYQKFARLLYIGERSYAHYKRLGCPEEKLVFSPYCVDVLSFETDENARTRLRAQARRELGISGQQIALLFSGKLSQRKEPDLILKAIKLLSAEIREGITVIFLGSGQMAEELKRLAQGSPSLKTIFLGFQNQTRLSSYYHAADLLVLPSREGETWGLVVNEALHHGLPCIVSEAVGCAPDLIEQGVTGYRFETGSAHSLAWALQQAFKLVGCEIARQDCRKKVSGYSVENAAKGIAEAYWQILAA
jgi:glycosyltransferase involved in cell wall biosynthesis